MKRVVVIGSAVIDILATSSDLKVMKSHQVSGGVALCEVYGGKSEADQIVIETGGAGTNVAVGLAKLGVMTGVLARIGNDWASERVVSALKLAGVDTSSIQVDEKKKTGISIVLVASDGGRSIITHRGASKEVDGEKVDWHKLKVADWVQISSMGGDLDLVENIKVLVKGVGGGLGWNPGSAELKQKERLLGLLMDLDLLILNRMEADGLVGGDFLNSKELARRLVSFGVKTVVITDGKRGAGVLNEDTWYEAASFKTHSIDDTGAGDGFVCGFLSGLLENQGVRICLKRGLANGASVVTKLGAKEGQLHKNTIGRWLQKRLTMNEERV